MSTQSIVRKVREALVNLGVVDPPRFYMRRRPIGYTRHRGQGRGVARRIRRTSLSRLLAGWAPPADRV